MFRTVQDLSPFSVGFSTPFLLLGFLCIDAGKAVASETAKLARLLATFCSEQRKEGLRLGREPQKHEKKEMAHLLLVEEIGLRFEYVQSWTILILGAITS